MPREKIVNETFGPLRRVGRCAYEIANGLLGGVVFFVVSRFHTVLFYYALTSTAAGASVRSTLFLSEGVQVG